MKNDGATSEKIFEDRMNEAYGKEVFIERLPDTKSIKGMMGKGFIQARPSDYLVTLQGKMFYAEVKSCSNATSFPFSNFRTEQKRAMTRQRAAKGLYVVYVHNLLTDTWYVLEGGEILFREASGFKSIKWEEMKLWILPE